jgi:hypothetical protein
MNRDRRTIFLESDPQIVTAGEALMAGKQAAVNFQSLLAGRTIGLAKPLDAGQTVELVNIIGPAHCAMAMTLTLTPPRNGPGAGAFLPFDDAVAQIAWGAGGMQTYAEVDYGRGCTIPLFASAVQVNAFLVPPVIFPAFNMFGAFITHLTRAASLNPTRTIKGALAAASGETIFPPPFARAVRVYSSPGVILTINLKDQTGTTIGTVTTVAGANPVQVLLTGDTAGVNIVNAGGVGITYRAVFELDL